MCIIKDSDKCHFYKATIEHLLWDYLIVIRRWREVSNELAPLVELQRHLNEESTLPGVIDNTLVNNIFIAVNKYVYVNNNKVSNKCEPLIMT